MVERGSGPLPVWSGLLRVLVCAFAASHAVAATSGTVPLEKLRDGVLVLDADAIPSERFAAEEFQTLFQEATGWELPIAARAGFGQYPIYIGTGDAFQDSRLAFDTRLYGIEEFRIRVARRAMAVAGGRPRGALYGVYHFFERHMGVHFLTADHTHFPEEPPADLPLMDTRYDPPFSRFRWSYYTELSDHPQFAARLRNNAATLDPEYGGPITQPLISHTLYQFVPVEEYGEEHPEYFALVDGERQLSASGGGPQVCSTNRDVLKIVTEAVLAQLEDHPEREVISVSPNDNGAYCQCMTCAAIDEREGTHMGAHLHLVNHVARRVARKHPEVKIGTLAYWYTRKPPRFMQVEPNVQIQLCSFECSGLHAINDPASPANAAFVDDLEGWLDLTPRVYIWHYVTNLRFVDVPYPNLFSLAPTVRYYRDMGARGIFMQGNGRCPAGEFSDLRNYVISRLIWDPSLEGEELITEFLRLHYGPAAPPIRKAIDLLYEAALETESEPATWSLPEESGIDASTARELDAVLSDARTLAGDDAEIQRRVDKLRISAHKALLVSTGDFQYDEGIFRLTFPQDVIPRIEQYASLCDTFGMTRNAEFQPLEAYFDHLDRNRGGAPAHRVENDTWRLTVAPVIGGQVVELYHKPDERHFLPAYGSSNLNIPLGTHKLTDFLGIEGPEAPYEYERTGQGFVLRKRAEDRFSLEWRVELEPEPPHRVLGHVKVRNLGDTTRRFGYTVHSAYRAAGPQPESAPSGYYKDKDTAWETLDFGDEPFPDNPRTRGGAVAFFNAREGFGVRADFEPGQFERPGVAWLKNLSQVLIELPSYPVVLEPGGVFETRYVIRALSEPPATSN